jgi:hypothetical protein
MSSVLKLRAGYRCRTWPSVICALFFWLPPSVAVATEPAADGGSLGEVQIEWRRNEQGIEGVRASFLVEATPEILWEVLNDYPRFPELFRNVRKVTVLRELPDGAEVAFEVDARIRRLRYVLDRRYVDPGRRITWTKISGDLGPIYGGWTIESGPQIGWLRVTYESYVDVGWYVPTVAIRMSISREVRAMVQALRMRLAGVPASATTGPEKSR